MNQALKLLLIGFMSLAFVGCSSTGGTKTDSSAGSSSTSGGAETTGLEKDKGFSGDPLDEPGSLLATRVLYFDFDKSDVRGEFNELLGAHAAYLSANPSASVVLEGHADERGTREYNVALSERRAVSVRQYLTLQGARSSQIDIVGYGEERPVARGHDEDSWRVNRRVEIVYSR